jgi:hypothetical protein
LQADLSATLFEEQGAKQKAGKTEFKQADLFRHTTVHYGLAEAIGDGIVKKPILERVEAKNKKTGEPLPLINAAATNAWEKYGTLLSTGIERWKRVRDQLRDEGERSRKRLPSIARSLWTWTGERTGFMTAWTRARSTLRGTGVRRNGSVKNGTISSRSSETLTAWPTTSTSSRPTVF